MDRVESADGTAIAYERVGSGRPLVCVHGTGANRGSMRRLAASLDGVECVLVDRRGRGDSGDAEAYALEREVEDLLAVIEAVDAGDDKPALFGHSYGGIVSLEAARRTDRLGALGLYEPPVGDVEADGTYLRSLRERHDAGDERGVIRQFFESSVGVDVDDIWPTWRENAPPAHTFVRELEVVTGYEPPAALDTDVPALLIYGERSSTHLREATRTLRDAIPNSRVAVIEDEGHLAVLRAPDRLAATLRPLLDATDPDRQGGPDW